MSTPVPAEMASDESHSRSTASDLDVKSLHKTFDIEHMPVDDDPRDWSSFRKVSSLSNLFAQRSPSAERRPRPRRRLLLVFQPNLSTMSLAAIAEMEADLPATASQISWSLSIFIGLQGVMPLFWSAMSEIKGRKMVYVVSIAISTAGSVVVATSKTIGLSAAILSLLSARLMTTHRVIIFRCVQATGSSAVMAIGAATLADIFDPVERGQKNGNLLHGAAPGAPIMGGVLTTAFSWRGPFWFLAAVSGLSGLLILLFLKDTFRKERSLTYQNLLRSRLRHAASAATSCTVTIAEKEPPTYTNQHNTLPADVEKQPRPDSKLSNIPDAVAALPDIKLTLRDVNPIKPLWLVLRRMNNFVILFASGLCFAFNFIVVFTASRTLSSAYGYNALKVGLVLLSFGLGNLAGSVLGGRWSDVKLASLKAANGGVSYPEVWKLLQLDTEYSAADQMRLKSTKFGLILLPPSVLAYGWVSAKHVNVAAMCTFLFLSGFFMIWAYTSTLAYIVDANNGRSATAVATNSAFRGVSAFVATEVAVPLQIPLPTLVPAEMASTESHSHQTASNPDVKSLHKAFDIEHMPVEDDPRDWTFFRKHVVLGLVTAACMIAGLAAGIQNPAIAEMEEDLTATASQISWSLSIFIALQGVMPLFWSVISEIKGRKMVYVVSIAISTVASVAVATSKTIGLVIIFRCVQATGTSAVITLGAATLADIFDPLERGQKMGIYYMAPLLGPSLASIMGGVLTTAFSWRAPFFFLAAVSGLSGLLILLFLKDTFRKERSLTYQNLLTSRLRHTASAATTIAEEDPPKCQRSLPADLEKQPRLDSDLLNVPGTVAALPDIKLTLRDVNPLKPLWLVLRRVNNLVILFASGLTFAFTFIVVFTASRTLSSAYGFNALKVGLVLLSFGLGTLAGSVLGGRWSDVKLASLTTANGGVSYPEMRLKSTMFGFILVPPSVLAYGWVSAKHVNVAAMCTFLFLSGFFMIWAYTSTLAYIVDANNGRSAAAVATNSAFRGVAAFVATEVAVPLQDSLGDGWLYTIWAGLLVFVGLLVWLVVHKGGAWREAAEKREQAVAVNK
ncbi:Vacuolar DHA amino acid exporter [Mycena sanguinolenta]|uniref:Vacuolar DHA amino acid exporter n=1 Tax=Mycena sanguinolenta TaxID=230812 RepID=A0A8H7DFF7_9AGAR|nr:Vacuolar DHA amino acid exporter [Mycena sanguinolenta]